MAKGPKGETRPADVIGAAVRVMRIATGDESETLATKSEVAVARGRKGGAKGGAARQAALSPEERSQLGLAAAATRWGTKGA